MVLLYTVDVGTPQPWNEEPWAEGCYGVMPTGGASSQPLFCSIAYPTRPRSLRTDPKTSKRMPPKKKIRYETKCSLCDAEVNHLKRHTNRTHIPWYMCPAVACASCQSSSDLSGLRRFHASHSRIEGESQITAWFLLVNGFLLFISSCLGLGSLDALLGLVVDKKLVSPKSHFLEEEELFLKQYDRLTGLEPKSSYSASQPTRISELLNYMTLTQILFTLNPEQRTQSLFRLDYLNPDGSSPSLGHPVFKYHIIDGHFHMDQLVGKSKNTLRELETLYKSEINLVHAITNFVFPNKWGTIPELIASDNRISFTLGIHPHLLYRDNADHMFDRLERQFRQYPEAVAVGEIGLDFTTTCRCSKTHNRQECVRGKVKAQYQFLENAFKLADRLDKPVVIHCRDRNDGTAAKGVLQTLISLKLTHLKIQRHCFIGDSKEFDEWSSTLPNCYFSLSRQSTVDSNTRDALMLACHRKLLFETDSPYLPFPGDSRGHGPWRVGRVVQAVSSIVGVPVPELIRISNSNLAKLFGLSW